MELRMILLLALLLVTAHPCGSGPVVLSMTTPLDCAMDAGCTIENIGREDAYRVLCACQPVATGTWGAEFEDWSNWPECGGNKLSSTALVADSAKTGFLILEQAPIPACPGKVVIDQGRKICVMQGQPVPLPMPPKVRLNPDKLMRATAQRPVLSPAVSARVLP